jgi:4-hydroxy-3-methylbut-2-en-1-yl diphosphate reductase
MNINIVRSCGFCAGVKRAIELVQEGLKRYSSVYCLGELIHNETVVADLKREGLILIEDLKELKGKELSNAAVVIRSHGTKREVYDFLKRNNLAVIDATCVIVKKIQSLCRKFSNDGYRIIIFGDRFHHEVQSLVDYCNQKADIITETDQLDKSLNLERSILISQSTKDEKKFLSVYEELSKRGLPKSNFYNTICSDIKTRQRELGSLAAKADLVLVLGSRKSANTANLFSIAKESCAESFLISDLSELPQGEIGGSCNIAVATGASTPYNFLNSVVERIKNLYK